MIERRFRDWIEENLNTYSIFFLLVATIFFTPLFEDRAREVVERILISIIFITVVFITPKNQKVAISVIILILVLHLGVAPALRNPVLFQITRALAILIFLFATFRLVIEIAKETEVDAKVILDSVNGYLLLGLAFAYAAGFLEDVFPGAYSFRDPAPTLGDLNYFSFVTLASLGYGDITPQIPISRSLSILTAISGQMYMAIIIALIVGKYASRQGGK